MRALWVAYAVAPAIAPVTFVVLLLAVGLIAYAFGAELNPASFLVLPVLAFTVGLVASYLVAGVIGMPIAFYLRSRNLLSFYSIHLAAFLWSLVLAAACAAFAHQGPWQMLPLVTVSLLIPIAPPVLLSATGFWFLVRSQCAKDTLEQQTDQSCPR